MKSYTLLNKYSLITVVLFISSILNSEAASKSSDSLFDILKNEKMSVEQRIGSARNSTFFFQIIGERTIKERNENFENSRDC